MARGPLRKTEVGNKRLALRVEDDIARLDVAMHDSLLMGMVQRFRHDRKQLNRLGDGWRASRKKVAERYSLDILTRDKELPALAANFMNGDNVWMSEMCCGLCLVQQVCCLDARRNGQLERHLSLEQDIIGQPYFPACTLAKQADQ